MFSHVMVGADDVAASKAFYDAILGALGAKPGMTDDKGRVFYAHNGGLFMITAPIDGAPAGHANGGTIGFAAASPAAADAWPARSEERRVGTECGWQCRSRWWPDH